MIMITESGQITPGNQLSWSYYNRGLYQTLCSPKAFEVSSRAPEDRRRVPAPRHPHPWHGGPGQGGHGLQDPGGQGSCWPGDEAFGDQDGLGFRLKNKLKAKVSLRYECTLHCSTVNNKGSLKEVWLLVRHEKQKQTLYFCPQEMSNTLNCSFKNGKIKSIFLGTLFYTMAFNIKYQINIFLDVKPKQRSISLKFWR